MKLKICTTLMLLIPLISQAASLTTSRGIEVIALNGQEVNSTSEINLLDNQSAQVVVRFNDSFDNSNTTKVYKTRPYVFEIKEVAAKHDYRVSVPRMNTYNQAESYFENNKPWLLTLNGQQTEIKGEYIQASGFFAYSDIQKVVDDYNKEKGIIFNDQGDVEKLVLSKKGGAAIEPLAAQNPLSQLKLWYSQATKEERKQFRIWMIEQE